MPYLICRLVLYVVLIVCVLARRKDIIPASALVLWFAFDLMARFFLHAGLNFIWFVLDVLLLLLLFLRGERRPKFWAAAAGTVAVLCGVFYFTLRRFQGMVRTELVVFLLVSLLLCLKLLREKGGSVLGMVLGVVVLATDTLYGISCGGAAYPIVVGALTLCVNLAYLGLMIHFYRKKSKKDETCEQPQA